MSTTLTQEVSNLVASTTTLSDAVSQELGKWQNERDQNTEQLNTALASIDTYLQSARKEYPIHRLSTNQSLSNIDGSSLPRDWYSAGFVGESYTEVATINSATVNSNYGPGLPADAEELVELLQLNRDGHYYNWHAFKIVRVKWSGNDKTIFSFNLNRSERTLSPYVTWGFYGKLISGNASSSVCGSLPLGEWGLFGGAIDTQSINTAHVSIRHSSESGEMLIALPALVAGHVDLSNKLNWGQFTTPEKLIWD